MAICHDSQGSSEEQRKALRAARTPVDAADDRGRQAKKECNKVLEGSDPVPIVDAEAVVGRN